LPGTIVGMVELSEACPFAYASLMEEVNMATFVGSITPWLISSIFDFPDIGEGRVLPLIECKRTHGRLDALMTNWGNSSTLSEVKL